MTEPLYFQWQNEILCKSIYPMRETKLRDFLVYYMEIDKWAEYKNKDISSDVKAYTDAQKAAAITAFKTYSFIRTYFMRPDVRFDYGKFKPIDENELAQINALHNTMITSWSKDVRGERDFITSQVAYWEQHRKQKLTDVASKQRRVNSIRDNNPNHPSLPQETHELELMQLVTLPMADQELAQLRSLYSAFDKLEPRKLEWYQLQKKGQTNLSEEEYLVQFSPASAPTVKDIVAWKVEDYKNGLMKKNHLQLLEEVYQRFSKEPSRYPLWLQYMVVHFSGMRYKSAHGSWADPKDLVIRIRSAKVDNDLKGLDSTAIDKLAAEKVAAYEGASKPQMALAQDKEWKDKVTVNLANLKSNGPQTRRFGITSMLKDEIAYEVKSMTTAQVLDVLKSMKATFPAWAWKEIVKLTTLRVTEVTDPGWETLTQQEQSDRYLPQYNEIRMIMDAWENADITGWREEHGRSHELIVTRAVCNETAEHIQHLRGYLPPGGLTPKPKWYLTNETDNKIPGTPRPYYVKPLSADDYTVGASILWLRFVNSQPDAWQIAKPIETKKKEGLIPPLFLNRKAAPNTSNWIYKLGEVITRSRTFIDANKAKVNQQQWLRWIHEATVAMVAETADGRVILTFETALPDAPEGVSSIGMFKHYESDIVSIGTEDDYFGSFIGFVPEGQVPLEHLKVMLDWNRILRRQVA